MNVWRAVVAGILVAVGIYYINENLYTKHPIYIDNEVVDKGFKEVYNVFRQNFVDGWEHEGAALVVYHRGRKVIDVWGGYADKQAARKWQKDTLTVTFSTTKAVAALCVALLADRKLLNYNDLVIKYWPGFGKEGKSNVTVQMLMSHMAGLSSIDEEITVEAATDHDIMRKLLENAKPKWPPGTKTGYHVFTYGWLVDQLIRHCDPKKRGIGQFFKEEIADKYNIDYFIGLPSDQLYRVARMSSATLWGHLREMIQEPRLFMTLWKFVSRKKNGLFSQAIRNPSWMRASYGFTFNNFDHHRPEQAAVLGIGNARSLAKLFSKVRTHEIFGRNILKQLEVPRVNETDIVLEVRLAKGNGMLYFNIDEAKPGVAFGHTGHGCQQISYDPNNDVIIAYVTNGLKMGLYMKCSTYARLHNSIYNTVKQLL